MSPKFFVENRKRLMEALPEDSIVVLFAGEAPKKSADEQYPFTPNRHFYYLCGIAEAGVKLMLVKEKGNISEYLFIQKSDPVREKWVGKTISAEEAKVVSGVAHICYFEDFESVVHRHLTYGTLKHLGMDFERDGFDAPESRELSFAKACQARYPFVGVRNVHEIISRLRMVKSEEEIALLREAIAVTDEGIKALMRHAKAGMYEYALEAHFDYVLKSRGIRDYAFKTIAASGANATVLHYEANHSQIPEGAMILFDLGAQYQYYNADISRTFPVSGQFSERQKVFYNMVLEAQRRVIAAIRPGVRLGELNEIVKAYYLEALGELGMAQTQDDVRRYYYHGVSHFLGLDTHDVGSGAIPLEPGMVITVEPGIYIEEEAIGIRIEDDVVVTAEGCEVLSSEIIKTVEEIEAFMHA